MGVERCLFSIAEGFIGDLITITDSRGNILALCKKVSRVEPGDDPREVRIFFENNESNLDDPHVIFRLGTGLRVTRPCSPSAKSARANPPDTP